mgnify:CR=1 FL=1
MFKPITAGTFLLLSSCWLLAQAPQTVDFHRDVQPIFKAHCLECHGPDVHMNNFRLDRRRDALRGGTVAVIAPGNSVASRLYLRLTGTTVGRQMPLNGSLTAAELATIKAWIDQGATWPDADSGEIAHPPADARVVAWVAALREADRRAVERQLAGDPHLVSRRGPGGASALMFAALYGDVALMRRLLALGADPNTKNDVGATALMWAAGDVAKVRLLLAHGADANARSDEGASALTMAAGRFGSAPVLQLLLTHGADVNASVPSVMGPTTALSESAYAGDLEALRLLLGHQPAASTLPLALQLSLKAECDACFELMSGAADAAIRDRLLIGAVPPRGDGAGLLALLRPGAAVNVRDAEGRSLLMLASLAEGTSPATLQALLDRGADIAATSPAGANALDFAERMGRTANVALLRKAGAVPTPTTRTELPVPSPTADAGAAVARSLPLLQRVDVTFLSKSGCVSCHNNSLTALSVVAARQHGMQVNRETERRQTETIGTYLDTWHERALQHIGIPGGADTTSYLLLGMGAEGYVPNLATDAMAHYVRVHQHPDGHWTVLAYRPPLESSTIEVTAVSMHALQVFAPKAWAPDFDQAVRRAAGWLATAAPRSTEDHAYLLLGLDWAHAARPAIRNAARALIAEQRSDGGWAQLASLDSDAYATGEALVSLRQSGALTAADPVYRRGVQYLLHTQMADGSWFVRSRAIPLQPYFDSGFPYGRDQFISAAATNWATRALLDGGYPLSAAR